MWGGWFKTEKYMDTIKKSMELYQSQSCEKSVTEVAVVYDTYARGHHRKNASLEGFLQAISRTGAAYEQFALADVDKLDPNQYRSIILLNTHTIVPSLAKWKTDNHSILYVSSAFEEPKEGRTCHRKDGKVHVGKGYQEYFFSDVPSSQALREAFLTSGAHIYNFTDDIIYAYGKMVAIHAASDGEKRVFLPEKSAVKDAYSGEKMQPCDYFFDFSMKKGETRHGNSQHHSDIRTDLRIYSTCTELLRADDPHHPGHHRAETEAEKKREAQQKMTPEEKMEVFSRIISLATTIAHLAWEADYVGQIEKYAEEIKLNCETLKRDAMQQPVERWKKVTE